MKLTKSFSVLKKIQDFNLQFRRVFGYSAILSEEAYDDTAVVIENSVISFISKEEFFNVLNNSVVFLRLLLKSLSHEFSVMANLMAVLSQRTVRERVALSLLILHDKYMVSGSEKNVSIMLSRTDFFVIIILTPRVNMS